SRVNFNENVYVRVSAGSSGNSGNSASSAMNGFMSLLGIGDNSEKIIVKGSDYETMVLVANDIRYQLQQKEFISSSNTTFSGRQREIQLGFDPILLSSYDISRQNITAGLNSLNKELSTGTTLKLGEDEYDIVIKDDITEEEEKKLEQQRNKTVDDLRQVMIPDANSGLHQLQQIAKVKYSRGTAEVIRVNRDREITVSYYITQSEDLPKDILKGYQDEVDQLVEDYNLPAGIALQVDREKESMGEFEFLIIASLILIFMILASVFESVITPFVLMFSIPLAAIGSLLALVITGNSLLNANTMIGLLILLGVVVNNGIILIDYANILRSRGYTRNRAMITSGFARMRPILITSITTCIALLPMAMGDDEYAGAIGAPFAITVIGGLSFSALLTLVLVPTVYISMENIIKWYKELNHAIHLLHLALFGAGIFYIWARVDGIFYQLLHFMLLVTLIPGVTYFIRTTVRLANKKVISEDEPIVITIRNLVKIYDWPHLFIRQWQSGLQLRERLGLAKKYQRLFDFAGILWQVVFFGFTGYLAIVYLDSRTWIFFMSVTTCAGCLSLWTKLRQYLYFLAGANNKIVHYIDRTLYFGFPVLTVYLLFKRMDNMPLCITIAILWALGILIRQISNYLYDNEINVERLTGRFADTRRTFYTIIKSIPVIGKRRIPFKALRGVSFEIQTGMFGLLGPNGAGKSTLMRIVTGILEQSYGTIWINGMDTKKYREELQSLIGFLPQEFGTYETMSAWDYLDYQAILKGLMDSKVRSERLEYVLKAVHMYEKKDAKINSFSGGMKQRIGIALILLHLPRILVVDEPTAGLDPRERIRFRNLLVELSRDRIVIFSTHIIEDIASSCNQVAVINKGELKYYGKPTDMIYLAQNKVWTFDITPELFETLDPRLIVNHMQDGDMVSVRYISTEAPQANAVRTEPNLEDAYLCLLKNL
ncbi:MAG: efflux RND transporter permease subunit, partial [Bacteroidales bacterium]|nr:efflux RND transporter permease subunit [Bacteroidales bacterium]